MDENATRAASSKKIVKKADEEFRGEQPPCEVYVVGSGECEQLGLGDGALERKKPSLLAKAGFDRIAVLKVAVGGLHSMVCSVDGRVYSWGCNDDGALGRSGEENLPKLVTELADRGVRITAITCGDCHSCALSDAGNVWGWGSYKDANGHVGFPDFDAAANGGGKKSVVITTPGGEKALRQPVPQEFPSIVADQIVSGDNHTLALTSRGDMYSWGVDQIAQLGHGERTPEQPTDPDRDVQEQKYQDWKKSKLERLFPRKIDPSSQSWRQSDPGSIVRLIGCGSDFSFACIIGSSPQSHETWGCGLNGDYQLGLDKNSEAEATWTRIPALSGVRVAQISGGGQHVAALDANGGVWSWGHGERTGHASKEKHVKAPRRIKAEAFADLRVLQVRAGGSHTLACTNNGDVFTWGTGGMFQLGNVPRDVTNFKREEREVEVGPDEVTPYMVSSKSLSEKFVVVADGGSQHSVLLAWNGEPGIRAKRKREPVTKNDTTSPVPHRSKRPRLVIDPEVLAACLKELEEAKRIKFDSSALADL